MDINLYLPFYEQLVHNSSAHVHKLFRSQVTCLSSLSQMIQPSTAKQVNNVKQKWEKHIFVTSSCQGMLAIVILEAFDSPQYVTPYINTRSHTRAHGQCLQYLHFNKIRITEGN